MTVVWMFLSALITSQIFFMLNFDERKRLYFDRLPEWVGYFIPIGYAIFVIWAGLVQLEIEKEARFEEKMRNKHN